MSVNRLQNLMADLQYARRDIDIDPSEVYRIVYKLLAWDEGRITYAIEDVSRSLESRLLDVMPASIAVEMVRQATALVVSAIDAEME